MSWNQVDLENGNSIKNNQTPKNNNGGISVSSNTDKSNNNQRNSIKVNHDFDSIRKSLLDAMIKIYNNYQFVFSSLPKFGTKEDSKRLRDLVSRSLIEANELLITSEPNIKKLKNYLASPDKDCQIIAYKINEDFNVIQRNLIELNKRAKHSEEVPVPHNTSHSIDDSTPLLSDADYHKQQQLLKDQQVYLKIEKEGEFQDMIINERDSEIENIQKQMREVNQIFLDLSTLVQEQGGMMNSISENIITGKKNVDDAGKAVDESAKSQLKARNKLCIIAIIITVLVAAGTMVIVLLYLNPKPNPPK